MARRLLPVLIVLAACTSDAALPPAGDALRHTVFSEGRNDSPCVDGPEFQVVENLEDWIDVYDIQTSCETDTEIELPSVPFGSRVGIAAWWGSACVEGSVSTVSVDGAAGVLAVRARTTGQQGCAPGEAGLETFLSAARPEGGIVRAVFVLDDVVVGEIEL